MNLPTLGWIFAGLLFLYGLAATGALFRIATRLVLTERALRESLEDQVGETYIQSS
jgi:hypothetical protein